MDTNTRLRKTFRAGARGHPPASAFTLIEMVVAIAIIVILAAILVPIIGAARHTAYRAATLSLINCLQMSLRQYGADFAALPEDGNIVMRTRLEQARLKTFSSTEMRGELVVDGFGNPIYYDEVAGSGFNPWGGDPGPGDDPRGGSAKNGKSYDLWSLGNDGKPGGDDDITNWR
jgi:prepilin-type N-terminal cleavage/methylation domain-containing protein